MGLREDAIARFQALFQQARDHDGVADATAMTLATVSPDGRPAARTVLLKGCDERGFVFYTNTMSRKGEHLAATPRAALCFYWEPLAQQVLIEGVVAEVAAAEADAYFASRPRLSQIGAWASEQSQPLDRPETLAERVEKLEADFTDQDVPRPPHWSGFRVAPDLMEFWSAGDGRLHRRERYAVDAHGVWQWSFIYP